MTTKELKAYLFDMGDIKSFEQLKKEFGKNYDRLMYDMNLELMRKLNSKEFELEELKERIEKEVSRL